MPTMTVPKKGQVTFAESDPTTCRVLAGAITNPPPPPCAWYCCEPHCTGEKLRPHQHTPRTCPVPRDTPGGSGASRLYPPGLEQDQGSRPAFSPLQVTVTCSQDRPESPGDLVPGLSPPVRTCASHRHTGQREAQTQLREPRGKSKYWAGSPGLAGPSGTSALGAPRALSTTGLMRPTSHRFAGLVSPGWLRSGPPRPRRVGAARQDRTVRGC